MMVAGSADGGGGEVGSVSGSVSGGRVDDGGLEGGWLVGGGALAMAPSTKTGSTFELGRQAGSRQVGAHQLSYSGLTSHSR